MTKFLTLQTYLPYKGRRYTRPDKAGEKEEEMVTFRREGQEARLAFSQLALAFQKNHPMFQLEKVSNWANQAQLARPHFWVYLRQEEDTLADPLFAFRLYGRAEQFGISVEVSIIERKKNQESLLKQHRILEIPSVKGTYYYYQQGEEQVYLPATEKSRQEMLQAIQEESVRKVLAKVNIPWRETMTEADMLRELENGITTLTPYYKATKVHFYKG